MRVTSIDVSELGNRSYIVDDGTVAIVIDPSRRIQEVLDVAGKVGVTVRAVFETHIHNDYVTGGYALAQQLNVPYYVSAQDHVEFQRESIDNEQTVEVGALVITALATPGHTHNHLGFLVTAGDAERAFLSGGSLLYGAVGRTDLISEHDTLALARAQYKTAQFLRTRLDQTTKLYPTHGFGSFCAATETEHISVSTLEEQLKTNPVFTTQTEAQFARELVDGLDAFPAYYAYMGPSNLAGPLGPTLSPPARLTREAALSALHTGVAIVDLRGRVDYASRHLKGTYNIELSNDLATYVGWLIAWELPLIVVAARSEEVEVAQEQLSLIGRDLTGGRITASELLPGKADAAAYPVRTFGELAKLLPSDDIVVLDVRREQEWLRSHLATAQHIPLHELSARVRELSSDKEIWVYCASGFRSSIAASILDGADKRPVLIDDSFTNAAKVGLLAVEKKSFVDEVTNGTAQLVDVRDKAEWKAGHALAALHMPLGMILEGDVSSLDNAKPVYLYCDSGERSGMAENFLRGFGFEAVNIGGLSDWIQAGGEHE